MMIPAGRTAKLVKIGNPYDTEFRATEVCDKLKFTKPTPVIILVGAMTQRAGKALAGVCRAAFRTDACIIDSGIGSGIEKFCLRKEVLLVGIAPEKEVTYPKINPTQRKENELTNGHTHFMLIGDDEHTYDWGDEAPLKFEIAKRIAQGRSTFGGKQPCKIVTVLLGDNPYCQKDIEYSLSSNIPIVVLQGSHMANEIISIKAAGEGNDEEGEEGAKE